ncbi:MULTISPECIES: DUF6708 domain-containing protein [Enterobacteriaceae]|uniref:DUF6708 domain-containing protein n=1 Tax=Klebsiella sp. 141161 TaxID=3020037 RepID=UPI000DE08CF8
MQFDYLAKHIDNEGLARINAETRSNTDKLTHAGKLVYVNDDYCEITRNYSSSYGANILLVALFSPIILVIVIGVIVFLYEIIFDFEWYINAYWGNEQELNSTLLFHFAILLSIALSFIFSAIVNYAFFAPRHYPIRFNRKTGKIYVYEYILSGLIKRQPYTFFLHSPFYKKPKPECKEFDWSDIKGSYSLNYNAIINCHVYENHSIVDSFILTSNDTGTETMLMNNYKLWLWISSYMDFKDEMLDMTVNPNVGIYGRKVEWPEVMLKKSTTSSLDEYEKITETAS